MLIFYLIVLILYAILLLAMKREWDNNGMMLTPLSGDGKAALLIPFRNEHKNLPVLLLNLERIIPPDMDVLFIDDHSSDRSKSIVLDFLQRKPFHRWEVIDSCGMGKKAALTTGIYHTDAKLILVTDADCQLPVNWVSRMISPFQQEDVQLVAGPVICTSKGDFFSRFQEIEWASLLLVTNYLFSIGRPQICSGANMAYRKSAFLAVGGFSGNQNHLSGDDTFLLKDVLKNFGRHSVLYIKEREVLVETKPLARVNAFIKQRVRWASKWRSGNWSNQAFFALGSYLMAIVQLGSVFLLLGDGWSKAGFFLFWALKIAVEKNILGQVLNGYSSYPHTINYIITSLLHPVYLTTVGVFAFRGKYSWKGRKNHRKL